MKKPFINRFNAANSGTVYYPLAYKEAASDWFGPYGSDSPGVFYRYVDQQIMELLKG